MRLSLKERWMLHRIGKVVRDADPLLAAKLAIFSRLAAADPMPGHEQLRTPGKQPQEPVMLRHRPAAM